MTDLPDTTAVVDVHGHAVPWPFLGWLEGEGLVDLSEAPSGVVHIEPSVSGVAKGAPIPLARAQHDLAARRADLQERGITRQLVSIPPFLTVPDHDDPDLLAELTRRANDALAEHVAEAPGIVDALGYVPLGTPGAAAEARRCVEELGLVGLAIGTRGAGRELDDPVNEEAWAYLAQTRTMTFVHPNSVPGGARLHAYWLPQLVGFPAETALAVSRLVFGGVLERHAVNLVLAHGGGCLPALQGRLDIGWERKQVARTTPYPPSTYVGRLHFDTATFSPKLLRRLIEDFGEDAVVVGTDHPFELADLDPLSVVDAARLTPAARTKVLSATAERLLSDGSTSRRNPSRARG